MASTTGERIEVISPGRLNYNQGPDFLDAKIKVNGILWAGSVELHIQSADWEKHRHQADKNYNNVILHVVWEDNAVPMIMPILELRNRVPKLLLQRYEQLMNSSSFIPCENSIGIVKKLAWEAWKERLIVERLLRKAKTVEECLRQNNYHWEETFWWILARNFGMKVNAEAFETIARSLPLKLLAKHKNQIHQVESLLFGQAGLLNRDFMEDYPRLLQREYSFWKKKYRLPPVHQPVHFLRMRPGNFPSIRLAQLSMLIHHSTHLFSKIKENVSVKEVRGWFDVVANDYWHYHYRFEELSDYRQKRIGKAMTDNIIVNTIVPVLFAYGNYHKGDNYKEKALQWLEETDAENNVVTKGFQLLEIENRNALDSQSLIELKNEYCNKRRCLDCVAGNALLKNHI